MPCLSGNYNPAVGPLVQVSILRPEFALKAGGGSRAEMPSLDMFMALIDTGASTTCISRSVVDAVGLTPIGKTKMAGATGNGDVNQYAFGVGFLFNARQEATGALSGSINMQLVNGCEFADHGFGFDVLLGRDIICKGSFTLSFDGHWLLSM
jgi:Aspartyl protease